MAKKHDFGRRVARARAVLDVTARELDRRAALTEGMTSMIEAGDRGRRPTVGTVTALARALGVSPEWLVSGVGQGPVAPVAAEPPAPAEGAA